MQQGDQFENYGYDPYEQPPSRGLTEKIFGARAAQRLKSPAVAAAVLLVAGAAFAGILAGTYSGGGDGAEAVPTIRADAERFKTEPDERGGMEIAHRESTIFNTVRSVEPFSGDQPVENLLASTEETAPADKLQAFERVAAEEMDDGEAPVPDEADLEPAAGSAETEKAERISGAPENKEAETTAAVEAEEPAVEKAAAQAIKQDVEKIPPQEIASGAAAEKPETLHKPGASPETLEFVRSVLDKKDTKEVADAAAPTQAEATQVAAVAPASGNATSFRIDPAGTHYVQVASVTSPEATVAEWEKLQKSVTVLSGLDYRVQQADLGERGTYYRIQTGPFAAEQAKALCEAIKAQKPDGCLVVR